MKNKTLEIQRSGFFIGKIGSVKPLTSTHLERGQMSPRPGVSGPFYLMGGYTKMPTLDQTIAWLMQAHKDNLRELEFEFEEVSKYFNAKTLQRVILALFLSLACFCPEAKASLIDMNKIKKIESSGNPLAHRKQDNSRGLYQITPAVLQEWNAFHPRNTHTSQDLWNPAVNYKIADWYLSKRIPAMLKHYKKDVTVKNLIISYNAGISYVVSGKRLPKTTQAYLKKYGVR